MNVVANVGQGRYCGELIKENPLTVIMKIDPEELKSALHNYFMESGISMTEFDQMLKEEGIKKSGIIKRHKIKHLVRRC